MGLLGILSILGSCRGKVKPGNVLGMLMLVLMTVAVLTFAAGPDAVAAWAGELAGWCMDALGQ